MNAYCCETSRRRCLQLDVFASGDLQKMVRAYRPNVHFQDVDQCIPQHVSAGEDQERAFGWFPQGPDSGVE